jgi:hypothetical protein
MAGSNPATSFSQTASCMGKHSLTLCVLVMYVAQCVWHVVAHCLESSAVELPAQRMYCVPFDQWMSVTTQSLHDDFQVLTSFCICKGCRDACARRLANAKRCLKFTSRHMIWRIRGTFQLQFEAEGICCWCAGSTRLLHCHCRCFRCVVATVYARQVPQFCSVTMTSTIQHSQQAKLACHCTVSAASTSASQCSC